MTTEQPPPPTLSYRAVLAYGDSVAATLDAAQETVNQVDGFAATTLPALHGVVDDAVAQCQAIRTAARQGVRALLQSKQNGCISQRAELVLAEVVDAATTDDERAAAAAVLADAEQRRLAIDRCLERLLVVGVEMQYASTLFEMGTVKGNGVLVATTAPPSTEPEFESPSPRSRSRSRSRTRTQSPKRRRRPRSPSTASTDTL